MSFSYAAVRVWLDQQISHDILSESARNEKVQKD